MPHKLQHINTMASAETNKQHCLLHELSAQSPMDLTVASTQIARVVESSDTAIPSVKFTEQESPLLRLPGEIGNRIYSELFRSIFNKLDEKHKDRLRQWDPRTTRSLICSLPVCRQFHHESTVLLFRKFVVRRPYWRFWKHTGVSDLFTRTMLFCRAIQRYEPHLHFSVQLSRGAFAYFAPADAKALLEELARRLQKVVTLTFDGRRFWVTGGGRKIRKAGRHKYTHILTSSGSDARAWREHWAINQQPFRAKGSVGEYNFTYAWNNTAGEETSYLLLEGSLAQLDWDALKESILHE